MLISYKIFLLLSNAVLKWRDKSIIYGCKYFSKVAVTAWLYLYISVILHLTLTFILLRLLVVLFSMGTDYDTLYDILKDYILTMNGPENNIGSESGGYGNNSNFNNNGQNPNPNNNGQPIYHNNDGQNKEDSANQNDNTLPYSSDKDALLLKQFMKDRLNRHHVSKAETVPYNTQLDEAFTSQEHEYICDTVMNYKGNAHAYSRHVKGRYPERRYEGRITLKFIDKFFS